MNGFKLVKILRDKYPNLKTMILYSHYNKINFIQLFQLSVSAIVPKNTSKRFLINAIQSVYETGTSITQKELKILSQHLKSQILKTSLKSNRELAK